jgi:hypothetical protein
VAADAHVRRTIAICCAALIAATSTAQAARMRGEPGFATPLGAVRWWVAGRHATLTAWRRWPLPVKDHGALRRTQLFVIAYRRAGGSELGTFVTVVREGAAGPWKFLEATVQPPVVVSLVERR